MFATSLRPRCRPSAENGAEIGTRSNLDSPDESPTGINVRVFPALLQDRREVLTATSTSGNPTLVEGLIWPFSWTHSFCRLLLNDTERLTLALVVAAAVAPR
jgi:hypothetical protein